ncbi:MAG: hypothetical protein QME42_07795 [bacterium]|nr:hypothetical protein [bacterium]
MKKLKNLLDFIEDTINYFLTKVEGVSKELYFADRDIRSILDKTINDIILCLIDIAEECLKEHKKSIPDTYKDTILACYEPLGDIVLKIAPLVKHRNETIHQYLKINWQNIIVVKNSLLDIREFIDKAKKRLNQ